MTFRLNRKLFATHELLRIQRGTNFRSTRLVDSQPMIPKKLRSYMHPMEDGLSDCGFRLAHDEKY
jgi:hypothetical protein